MYTFDLFLIGGVYVTLFSTMERTLFIVWFLGITRGVFSSSYTFYPLFFLVVYLTVRLVKNRLKISHPFTQFLILFCVSIAYYFSDNLFNMSGKLVQRLFFFWPDILLLALINGVVGIGVFWVLSRLPVKVVIESEKGGF